MELSNVLFLLVILSFATKANPAIGTTEDTGILNTSLPVFTWIDQVRIEVEFPDGLHDRIVLWPAQNIGDIDVSCLYEGTMAGEASADIVVSGCKDDPLISITIHSKRLIRRTMFNVRNSTTEEIRNPYANGEPQNEVYDYEDEAIQRSKRSIFEDYIIEDYDEDYAADGNVDPPPRLKLDVKLGFEESLKTHLGGETAARQYVVKVFTHGRSYMRHNSLGTSLDLNLVGIPKYIANQHWTARRESLAKAKIEKINETTPVIFFCFDGDDDNYMGISRIRRACDPTEGVGIVKFRENVQLAANTYSHENGHLVGLNHDKEEDRKDGGNQDDPCHGNGFMSETAPADRPTQFTVCNARRFKLWYNNFGTCLTEVKIPANLKKCPYPPASSIAPCKCKVDSHYNAYLFCDTLNQKLLDDVTSNFQCRKKIYKMEINMMGAELNCGFGLENIGSIEIEYLHIYNVSKITADIESNAFKGSSKTLKEIKIQRLSGNEKGGRTIRTEAFSNLVALKNVHLGEDFQTLQSKSFSDLPSVVNLKVEGVKTIETNAFYNMVALRKLDFTQSPVETINTEAFYNLPLLTIIDFNTGTIVTLRTKSFSGLNSVEKLDIGNNRLQEVITNAFYNLPELTLVNLTKNEITDLHSNIFSEVPKLAIIDLSHNSISSLPSKVFENLPSITNLYLNNNNIASIHSNAIINLPQLKYLDLSKNEIQELGNCLENIKNRDLIINLSETKIHFLMEESFKPFVDNIVKQRGTGYIDLGSLVLECGCDIHWLFNQQDNSDLTKFHNAVCEEGHTLEEVDANLLEGACPLEDCPGIIHRLPAFLFFQREEIILKKDNLITTLPRLGKQYLLSVDFIATSISGFRNIIHLTTFDRNTALNGGRVPAVWMTSNKCLYFEASIDGKTITFTDNNITPTNKWINVQLSQKLENGKYMFTVLVDGKQQYQKENTKPQEFTRVKVYAANNWYPTLQGSIRNFFLQQS